MPRKTCRSIGWVGPADAAAGALDNVPTEIWPRLAARWRAAGFDSPLLRQLAELRTGQRSTGPSARKSPAGWAAPVGLTIAEPSGTGHLPAEFWIASQVLDLMPGVLRSLGFDPAPADAAFVTRCQTALDVVQRDLDTTGYGQFQMHATPPGGWPVSVHAALPDGSYWSGAWPMTRDMDDTAMLFNAASGVSGTIEEVHEIEWPVCAAHADIPPTSPLYGEELVDIIGDVVQWRCPRAGHLLAPVGQLTASIARTL